MNKTELQCYHSPADPAPRSVIPLASIVAVIPEARLSSSKNVFAFGVVVLVSGDVAVDPQKVAGQDKIEQETHVLCTETADLRNEWVEALDLSRMKVKSKNDIERAKALDKIKSSRRVRAVDLDIEI